VGAYTDIPSSYTHELYLTVNIIFDWLVKLKILRYFNWESENLVTFLTYYAQLINPTLYALTRWILRHTSEKLARIDVSWHHHRRWDGEAADAASAAVPDSENSLPGQVDIAHPPRRQPPPWSASTAAGRWWTWASGCGAPRRSPTGSRRRRRALFAVTSLPTDHRRPSAGRWGRTGSATTDCRGAGRCRRSGRPAGASPRRTWCCRGSRRTSPGRRRPIERSVDKVLPHTSTFLLPADQRQPRSTRASHERSRNTHDRRRCCFLTRLGGLDFQSTSRRRHHISMSVP